MNDWPEEWMAAVIGCCSLAIVVPWKLPHRFRLPVGVILVGLAAFLWSFYESELGQLAARPGALIRVDLLLIIPLFFCGLINLLLLGFSTLDFFWRRRQG